MYTLEIPLNTKGYADFLAKRFKYGYKLKRAVTNWINCQEHRRVSSEEYKSLSLRTKIDLTGRYLLTLINRITKENRHQQGQVNHVHGKP